MLSKINYTLFLLVTTFKIISQESSIIQKNLVPNGSFENYRKKSSKIKNAIPWSQIASVDYYQSPLSNDTSTSQKGAKSGNCYMGLRFQKKYKEFAQVKLADALHRGTVYQFDMYVRLAFWSNASLKSLGILFTKAGYKGKSDVITNLMVDSVCKKGGLTNDYKWFKISAKYQAEGGEKYM
ncbi:MAG: hypothetical protein ACK50L_06980, partial [Bacteroidota bacterium]